MSTKRKTERGEPITNINDLLAWIRRKQWIYYKHKPTSYAWCYGWRLGMIFSNLRAGHIYQCLRTSDRLPYISGDDYSEQIDRLAHLHETINEIDARLHDPTDDRAWCLGDPYEALSAMQREASEIEYQLLNEEG